MIKQLKWYLITGSNLWSMNSEIVLYNNSFELVEDLNYISQSIDFLYSKDGDYVVGMCAYGAADADYLYVPSQHTWCVFLDYSTFLKFPSNVVSVSPATKMMIRSISSMASWCLYGSNKVSSLFDLPESFTPYFGAGNFSFLSSLPCFCGRRSVVILRITANAASLYVNPQSSNFGYMTKALTRIYICSNLDIQIESKETFFKSTYTNLTSSRFFYCQIFQAPPMFAIRICDEVTIFYTIYFLL